jgi:hypothetical protein
VVWVLVSFNECESFQYARDCFSTDQLQGQVAVVNQGTMVCLLLDPHRKDSMPKQWVKVKRSKISWDLIIDPNTSCHRHRTTKHHK